MKDLLIAEQANLTHFNPPSELLSRTNRVQNSLSGQIRAILAAE